MISSTSPIKVPQRPTRSVINKEATEDTRDKKEGEEGVLLHSLLTTEAKGEKGKECLSLLVGVGPFDDPFQCAVDVGNVLARDGLVRNISILDGHQV